MTALKAYIAASFVAAIIAGAGFVYLAGKSHERDKTDLNNARDYIEGTQDAQDSQTDLPDDGDGVIEWLLRFGQASD